MLLNTTKITCKVPKKELHSAFTNFTYSHKLPRRCSISIPQTIIIQLPDESSSPYPSFDVEQSGLMTVISSAHENTGCSQAAGLCWSTVNTAKRSSADY